MGGLRSNLVKDTISLIELSGMGALGRRRIEEVKTKI